MEHLKGLNTQQIQAVKETEGYVRVIAGAGSGKTKTLVSRYVHLVKDLGVNPSNILCVTFTNNASREMRNRIKAQLEGLNLSEGYITTYHGFCVKVLREDIYKLQIPQSFTILDSEDQKLF
jgi:DNA helicase-2/ATP-dependent DNA helicase PcrA